jgi:hypothetical protein
LGRQLLFGLLYQPRMIDDDWGENGQGKPNHSEKTCTIATLSITNPTCPDLGSNPDRRGGKPATNLLRYGTTIRKCKYKFTWAVVWIHKQVSHVDGRENICVSEY